MQPSRIPQGTPPHDAVASLRLLAQHVAVDAAGCSAGRGVARAIDIFEMRAHLAGYGTVTGEPLGVVDVLTFGKPAVDRLPQETEQPMADGFPMSAFRESQGGHSGQVEGIIQLVLREQADIGGDLGALEFEPEVTLERNPQGFVRFARRVRHSAPV